MAHLKCYQLPLVANSPHGTFLTLVSPCCKLIVIIRATALAVYCLSSSDLLQVALVMLAIFLALLRALDMFLLILHQDIG